MAGLFEETARFISFKILKKKYNGIGTGLAYGIGHGGIEAVLLAGLSMIVSIVFCIMINTVGIRFSQSVSAAFPVEIPSDFVTLSILISSITDAGLNFISHFLTLSTKAFISLLTLFSVTLEYLCGVCILLWPSILLTLSMDTPLVRASVAKVCLAV
ncbi:MAG: YhfC family intramembrane metalloprotease [Tannerellaceae bacterium]|nr:YhfC family intramembrane metalloprotease [Tannerellaceae bacterium]